MKATDRRPGLDEIVKRLSQRYPVKTKARILAEAKEEWHKQNPRGGTQP